MAMSHHAQHRARYLVPLGAAAITAAIIVIPQAASGVQHPNLPPRTAAQLLATLEQATVPQFSGTTVETARLGLPSLGDANLPGGVSPGDGSGLTQIVTLLTGSHTAQLAYGGPDRQRVAIFLSDLSETDVVHNGHDLWTYSSDSNSVSHQTLTSDSAPTRAPDQTAPVDPTKAAERLLKQIDPSTKVTVDRTAEVAGRPAYQLDLTPRDGRTLIGSVRIALDSKTSLPLRVEVWSRSNHSDPAFSVGFTSISMKAPGASTFNFSKPPTARLEPLSLTGENMPNSQVSSGQHSIFTRTIGKNWTSVFVEKLSPPAQTDTAAPSGPRCEAVRKDSSTGTTTKTVVPCNGNGPGPSQSIASTLGQLGTAVPGGHLLTTNLVSVLVTNDNRILVGAVTPTYLEQIAATAAAQQAAPAASQKAAESK